ncbi:MAG: GEVED domain-containing protein [Chitinophagales bacterium]|nr:GEVED domain-containing protein [Chitinophagales bacterium]
MKKFLSLLFSLLLISYFSNAQYCNSNFSDATFEYITNVNFAGINNSSGGNVGGPVDYTSQVAIVSPGTTYPLSVTIEADASEYVYAFIDWNQNGVLDDTGEAYTIVSNTSSNGPHIIDIDVPIIATSGNTRMRVMLAWAGTGTTP